ncbi:hypothetical protein [Jiella pacifica]|uniref:Uncharacterized protein n=1 Tax=Jiella pacifica TaxID=2696469 RepID=A0A6N9T4M3_9HYPH|nr:hypothetical protein [Jiella pacifica]NDW05016.1 hypothetical protein [Jiella pacifica]
MSVEKVTIRGGGKFIYSVSSKLQDWDNGRGPVTYEVAVIETCDENYKPEERRLAMRWHGSGNSGLGFPNSFGHSSWFEVDPQLEISILNGLGLSAKVFSETLSHLSYKPT